MEVKKAWVSFKTKFIYKSDLTFHKYPPAKTDFFFVVIEQYG